ncbi:MAG: hypothetical protein AABY88_04385 [Pseudomonadota bacterium]
MKKVALITLFVSNVAFYPAYAGDNEPTKGVAVIGVKGEFSPEFTWRSFDPLTGKLLPFSVTKNVTKGAQKALSNLFGGLGRLGRSDKRYNRNRDGVSYRMAELRPGTYVLETVTVNRRWSVLDGQVPIVRVVSGQATYVGDYTIEVGKKKGAKALAAGRSVTDASAFLATFPNVKASLVDEGSETATLDCKGKLVAFADQLVCDSEQSLVSNIAFRVSSNN